MSTGFVDWATTMKVKKNVNKKEQAISLLLFRGMIIMVEVCNQSTSIKVIHFAIEIWEELFVEIENTTISRHRLLSFRTKISVNADGKWDENFFLCQRKLKNLKKEILKNKMNGGKRALCL
jgi:hypothetical protein